MRAGTSLSSAGKVALVLSMALGGCDRLKRNDPAQPAKERADVRRQQAACGSPSANDRLKNSIFDHAIAERKGDRGNLDILADYSVARLQDPVVKGWDRSLDVTRCEGRFILEIPPGAERAFAGERQLQADIEYTAQASADGAGLVYQQKGAEPIVAKLAAFNLGTGAYRPPPAIDEPQAPTGGSEQTSIAEPKVPPPALGTPPNRSRQVLPHSPAPSASLRIASPGRVADRISTEPSSREPNFARAGNGEATVRAFYEALRAGNGAGASSQVIPEKRSSGAFSPGAISRFYGRLPEPITLTGISPLAGGAYHVTYGYSAGRSRCNGSAVVRLTSRGGRDLIRSIHALNGC